MERGFCFGGNDGSSWFGANMKLCNYQTLVFDCDGVVLNSNKVKTEAFYQVALRFGEDAARRMVEYHVARGGVSRYLKFEWLLQQVVGTADPVLLGQLLQSYSEEVHQGLLTCDIAPGLVELRAMTDAANWLIVSGGDQNELRTVFAQRGIASLFDGGIFGSPDTKDVILAREMSQGNIKTPALFLGDSQYDHQASAAAGLDFVFLSGWSEFSGFRPYCDLHQIKITDSISTIVNRLQNE